MVKPPEALPTLPEPHAGAVGAWRDRGPVSTTAQPTLGLPQPHRALTCGHKVCVEQGCH